MELFHPPIYEGFIVSVANFLFCAFCRSIALLLLELSDAMIPIIVHMTGHSYMQQLGSVVLMAVIIRRTPDPRGGRFLAILRPFNFPTLASTIINDIIMIIIR